MNIQLYILESNNQIVAISEEEKDIKRYILQFYEYFQQNQYNIKIEYYDSEKYLNKYIGRYLYDFTDEIILTDDEILYYHKTIFDEMYYQFKYKLAEIMYDPKLLDMKIDERNRIVKQNEEYFNSVKTFDLFINRFDPQVLLKKYILEPILTIEL